MQKELNEYANGKWDRLDCEIEWKQTKTLCCEGHYWLHSRTKKNRYKKSARQFNADGLLLCRKFSFHES